MKVKERAEKMKAEERTQRRGVDGAGMCGW